MEDDECHESMLDELLNVIVLNSSFLGNKYMFYKICLKQEEKVKYEL